MKQLPEALAPLANYKQFILYKLVPSNKPNGKINKLPVDYRTLQVFNKNEDWQNNPDAWTDAQTAITTAKLCGDEFGVGFFFTKNDPFYFVDIDNCLNKDNLTWSDTANAVLSYFPGCAVELSQSGRGMHVFGVGQVPEHGCRNDKLGLEFYTESRFVALTGKNCIGRADVNSQYLQAFVTNYMTAKQTFSAIDWTTEAVAESNPIDDDKKLISKAIKSTSAAAKFGQRASFKDLWECDVNALIDAYPPDESDSGTYDESAADMALIQHLAFWTGKNCERILQLMPMSQLERPKWERDDYLKRTIKRAVNLQEKVYTGPPKKISIEKADPVMGQDNESKIIQGYQFLGATQQQEHFKGCVYVRDIHKVFTPDGDFLKPDQFNASYGGYIFPLDDGTNKKETRKAWEAFTESQLVKYKKAATTVFRPDLEPGAFVHVEHKIAVNMYVPVFTKRLKGDATPFLNHLTKVLPVELDRQILLAYMAACVQHKGFKFQWAPLLQGIQGNGKTLFTRCVAFAIGEKFTHKPPADQITEKYNEWLYGTLFIGVEDIYVPDHKINMIEILKPMVTDERQAIRSMGVAQIMKNICCNFMFNSNHKDAIRLTRNDRRYCVFYSAQQDYGDLERDGMGGDYFPNLYNWLKFEDGYAIVANYLETYQIPDSLNPAKNCHRAPSTSSTEEAINASLGGIEQEILEAVEQGRPGFGGGWISSTALEMLLKDMGSKRMIPLNKRKQMLYDMGYIWHPNLAGGRVNNFIAGDGGKPKLYIKAGHVSCNLQTSAEISKAYQAAQNGNVIDSLASSKFNRI